MGGVHQFAPFLLNLLRNLIKNKWKEDIPEGLHLDKLLTSTLLSLVDSSSRSLCSLCNPMDQSTFCRTKWTWQRSCDRKRQCRTT